jgi:hypothetical protein
LDQLFSVADFVIARQTGIIATTARREIDRLDRMGAEAE